MSLVVQKYGGSSLKDSASIVRVADRIIDSFKRGNLVVVVVSAMGNTTDQLTDLAYSVSSQPEPREMDVLLSTGELVSCTLVTMALREQGQEAISLSGAQAGIKTDDSYGKARITLVEPKRILNELAKGKIVIVAGFQGIANSKDITTLGRGASDLSAIALAASLKANRCEIYTNVEGIFTADPNIVSEARKLTEIGFEEMLEMSSYGAKMNPRSIELGMTYNIPIIVASSLVDAAGTLIHKGADMDIPVGEVRNRVRGIATDISVSSITIHGIADGIGTAATIFEPLSNANISVDVIVQNTSIEGATNLTFTVSRTELDQALEVVKPVAVNMRSRGVTSNSNLAKVSIVGTGMQDSPGYASKMFRAIANENINIQMITTSEIRITCVVDESEVDKAARALHETFELDVPN